MFKTKRMDTSDGLAIPICLSASANHQCGVAGDFDSVRRGNGRLGASGLAQAAAGTGVTVNQNEAASERDRPCRTGVNARRATGDRTAGMHAK